MRGQFEPLVASPAAGMMRDGLRRRRAGAARCRWRRASACGPRTCAGRSSDWCRAARRRSCRRDERDQVGVRQRIGQRQKARPLLGEAPRRRSARAIGGADDDGDRVEELGQLRRCRARASETMRAAKKRSLKKRIARSTPPFSCGFRTAHRRGWTWRRAARSSKQGWKRTASPWRSRTIVLGLSNSHWRGSPPSATPARTSERRSECTSSASTSSANTRASRPARSRRPRARGRRHVRAFVRRGPSRPGPARRSAPRAAGTPRSWAGAGPGARSGAACRRCPRSRARAACRRGAWRPGAGSA